jgi:hypothetical protein
MNIQQNIDFPSEVGTGAELPLQSNVVRFVATQVVNLAKNGQEFIADDLSGKIGFVRALIDNGWINLARAASFIAFDPDNARNNFEDSVVKAYSLRESEAIAAGLLVTGQGEGANARSARPVRFENPEDLFRQALTGASPELFFRELAANSIQSHATRIDLSYAANGDLIVIDNGKGVPAHRFELSFGDLSTRNEQEPEVESEDPLIGGSRMHVGVRAWSLKLGTPLEITTSVGGEKALEGRWDLDSKKKWGLLREDETQPAYRVVDSPFGGKTGTRIVVEGFKDATKISAIRMAEFLSNRFLSLDGVKIRVYPKPDFGGTPIQLRSVVDRFSAECGIRGKISLENCVVHWGIRNENIQETNGNSDRINLPPISYLWEGELIEKWPLHRGGGKVLENWGIAAGGDRVVIMVDTTGPGTGTGIIRDKVQGFDHIKAQEQFIESLPEALRDFVREAAQAAKRKTSKTQVERVHRLLQEYGVKEIIVPSQVRGDWTFVDVEIPENRRSRIHGTGSGTARPRIKTPPVNPGGATVSVPTEEAGFESKLKYDWVGAQRLGTDPLRIDYETGRFLFNEDFPQWKRLFDECRTDADQRIPADKCQEETQQHLDEIKARIVTQIVYTAHGSYHSKGVFPSEESLQIVAEAPIVAEGYVLQLKAEREAK